jgi:hypothetical protein
MVQQCIMHRHNSEATQQQQPAATRTLSAGAAARTSGAKRMILNSAASQN